MNPFNAVVSHKKNQNIAVGFGRALGMFNMYGNNMSSATPKSSSSTDSGFFSVAGNVMDLLGRGTDIYSGFLSAGKSGGGKTVVKNITQPGSIYSPGLTAGRIAPGSSGSISMPLIIGGVVIAGIALFFVMK